MNKLKLMIVAAMALVGLAVLSPAGVYAQAVDPIQQVQNGVTAAGGDPAAQKSLTVRVKDIVNVILFVLGAVAVIMIIIGGFRYVLSAGDSGAITSAKNTIFYAVIGLIVAILAYAIVNFVVTSFK